MGTLRLNILKFKKKVGANLSLEKPSTLYHYCSLNTFLSIVKNSSIWLSDVQKSNDKKEMAWFRHLYYEYLLDLYEKTTDKDTKTICEIIFTIAAKDGFDKCPPWLLPAVNANSQQLIEIFGSLRVYAFCLSELSDSLGQWRGYANDGKGIAIGFSREYLDTISGYSLRCPAFNFLLGSISYKNDFSSLFEKMFSLHNKSNNAEFILNAMIDLTHTSALFKHHSFKEEYEWRIIYSMSDYRISEDVLNFKHFDDISSQQYKNNFGVPKIDYIASENDIIPHIEIQLKDLSAAIDRIIIGPKCIATEKDIRHVLLRFGVINSVDDDSIEIIHSDSSYR
jgi:hypothetical protein